MKLPDEIESRLLLLSYIPLDRADQQVIEIIVRDCAKVCAEIGIEHKEIGG